MVLNLAAFHQGKDWHCTHSFLARIRDLEGLSHPAPLENRHPRHECDVGSASVAGKDDIAPFELV